MILFIILKNLKWWDSNRKSNQINNVYLIRLRLHFWIALFNNIVVSEKEHGRLTGVESGQRLIFKKPYFFIEHAKGEKSVIKVDNSTIWAEKLMYFSPLSGLIQLRIIDKSYKPSLKMIGWICTFDLHKWPQRSNVLVGQRWYTLTEDFMKVIFFLLLTSNDLRPPMSAEVKGQNLELSRIIKETSSSNFVTTLC